MGVVLLAGTFLLCCESAAQEEGVVDFESDRWVLRNAEVTEYLGRKCLIGFAFLKDVEFENGVIEVDIAVENTDVRSYPGVIFRMQSEDNYERFYLRPHRAPLYPDALQYTPVINGIAGWQLYSGDGFTGVGNIPAGRWIPVKIEVSGSQARVFVGETESPALVVDELKHGVSKGSVGVFGARDRTAYFSGFSYRLDNDLRFDPPPRVETPPGMITGWQLSEAFSLDRIDLEEYPDEERLASIEWEGVESEPSGLVDIARRRKRMGPGADVVFARTVLRSEQDRVMELMIGYSDAVSVFLNGKIQFFGNSSYRSRDPSFLGIVGLFDSVYLPLRTGPNELLLAVAEGFGGWGFMCQDGDAVLLADGVTKRWETAKEFRTPESVLYDPDRRVLYVSNYDVTGQGPRSGSQYVSKVALDGRIEDLEWVSGLRNPTGMVVYGDRLYVVERGGLVEIDPDRGEILERYEAPESGFLNDVGVDESGRFYLSDSRKSVIYRFADGRFEEWLSEGVQDPNALLVDGGRLVWGNNGDQCLKAVDLLTKTVTLVAELDGGNIDGIKLDRRGDYLVSHWEGRLFQVTRAGKVTKLLETSVPGHYCADFDYVAEKRLVVVPTFYQNRVAAYELR